VQGNAFLSPLCLCSWALYTGTLSWFRTSGSAGDSLLALVHYLTLIFIKGMVHFGTLHFY
jgi:hypothetical protein